MSKQPQQVKAGALYLGATLLDSVVPLITLPLFTRVLRPEDFGILALAQVYALIVGGLANFGMATAYNRNYFEYCEDKQKTGELFFTTISFVAALSSLLLVLTFVFQDGLTKLFLRSDHHGALLLWALTANVLVNLRLFFLTYLRNTERPKQYVLNTVCLTFLTLIFSLYFVMIVQLGVVGIFCGQVLASSLVLLGLLIQFLRELPVGWNTKILKEELRIGSPTVPMAFFSVVSNHFDKYLLGLLATLDGVGVYSIGQKIANLNFTFSTSLQNVFSPQVYKKMFSGTAESKKEIGIYLVPFAYIICCVALLVILFADEILHVMAAPSFASAADIVIILTLFYTVLFFAKINGDQLIFAKKTHLTTILVLGAALLNIIVNIPFIKIWGAEGAAWATLLARSAAGVVIFIVAQRFFRIDWQVKPMALIFGSVFFLAIGLLVLRQQPVAYGALLIYKILALSFYLYMSRSIGLNVKSLFSGR
jgi:O-antigen/teichoic acid export membrane protein